MAGKEVINRNTGDKLGRITLSGGIAQYVDGEAVEDLIEQATPRFTPRNIMAEIKSRLRLRPAKRKQQPDIHYQDGRLTRFSALPAAHVPKCTLIQFARAMRFAMGGSRKSSLFISS